MEEEWESFKEVVNKSAEEVCGKRRVRGQGIKRGSEWWNEGVKRVLKEKIQCMRDGCRARGRRSGSCTKRKEERQRGQYSRRSV